VVIKWELRVPRLIEHRAPAWPEEDRRRQGQRRAGRDGLLVGREREGDVTCRRGRIGVQRRAAHLGDVFRRRRLWIQRLRTDDGVEVDAGRPRPEERIVIVAFAQVARGLFHVVFFDEVVRDRGLLIAVVVTGEDLNIVTLLVLVRRLGRAVV